MKIAVIIVRTLMGLLFLMGSITYFLNAMPQPELSGNAKLFMEGMVASGYLMTLVKLTELVCGLAFITGYFVPLASVLIAPVIVNIVLFNIFVDPSALPISIPLMLGNIFLAYTNWNKYKPMLAAK